MLVAKKLAEGCVTSVDARRIISRIALQLIMHAIHSGRPAAYADRRAVNLYLRRSSKKVIHRQLAVNDE